MLHAAPMRPDPDADLRRALARYRGFATGLLVLMGALVGVSYALPPGFWAALLLASAKAGFVGGIADWFAVTALFRHPLGLPIPHTAIIPRQKARLGRALGRFVAGHVITPSEVSRVLGRLDFATILARFLRDPEATRPTAQAHGRDAAADPGLGRRRARAADRGAAGPAAGGRSRRRRRRRPRAAQPGRRRAAPGGARLPARGDARPSSRASTTSCTCFIEEKVRAQGGRLLGWVLGAQVADRVLGTLREELERIGPDGSAIRAAFDVWVNREIERMETDPARAAEIGRAIRRVVAHETIQAWLWDVWARLRLALEADAARPGGYTISVIEGALANLGSFLAEDPAARARVQTGAPSGVVDDPAAQRPGATRRLHRRRGGELGRKDRDRQAGAAGRPRPAICPGERDIGRVPGGRRVVPGAHRRIRHRRWAEIIVRWRRRWAERPVRLRRRNSACSAARAAAVRAAIAAGRARTQRAGRARAMRAVGDAADARGRAAERARASRRFAPALRPAPAFVPTPDMPAPRLEPAFAPAPRLRHRRRRKAEQDRSGQNHCPHHVSLHIPRPSVGRRAQTIRRVEPLTHICGMPRLQAAPAT